MTEKNVRKALLKHPFIDLFTLGNYRLSPYAGCGHGCLYCDGRAEKYYFQGDFEKAIVFRKNIPRLLAREVPRLRGKNTITLGSGITDVYQPVERERKLTRACLEILTYAGTGVRILTKSNLILRDLDLLEKIHQNAGLILFISLTSLEDSLLKTLEPGASSATERVEVIEAFKKRKIPVGILAMPVLPGITDTEENLDPFYQKMKALKVDFIMPGWLTLRPGRQKNLFIQYIQDQKPELLGLYSELYSKNRESGNPLYTYRQEIQSRFARLEQKWGIPSVIPHRAFKNQMEEPVEIFTLLKELQDLWGSTGVDITPLKEGISRFQKAVFEEKREWTNTRELLAFTENSKLEGFLQSLLAEGCFLDPLTRKVTRD